MALNSYIYEFANENFRLFKAVDNYFVGAIGLDGNTGHVDVDESVNDFLVNYDHEKDEVLVFDEDGQKLEMPRDGDEFESPPVLGAYQYFSVRVNPAV